MPRSSCILSPARVRIAFGLRTHWQFVPWEIVHVGQSAIVCVGPKGQLLAVSAPHRGLVPGGLQITETSDYRRLAREFSRCQAELSTVTLPWADAVAVGVDLGVSPAFIAPSAVDALLRALRRFDAAAPAQRSAAAALASACLGGKGSLSERLLELLGAGPGTTPAGDDVLCGVLAGLAAGGLRTEIDAVSHLLTPLLPRTTLASRHELSYAMTGQFAEPMLALIRAVQCEGGADQSTVLIDDARVDAAGIDAALDGLTQWGASSGIDFAFGLAAVLRQMTPRPLGLQAQTELTFTSQTREEMPRSAR